MLAGGALVPQYGELFILALLPCSILADPGAFVPWDGAEPDDSLALEHGAGWGEHQAGGCCGAPLLPGVPCSRLSFIGNIRSSWACMRRSHICTCICMCPTYMDAYALLSAPGPAHGGSLFWGMQVLLGVWNAGVQAGTRLPHRAGSCGFTKTSARLG